MSEIQNKVVIITGASSGLGEATARRLANNGAKLMLAARREDRLKELVTEIQQNGGTANYQVTDVSDRSQVEALVKATHQAYERIDVLVNNAGLMPLSPLAETKVDEWERMVDVNIKGVLYGIAAVMPIMQQQKSGHIINLSSVAGNFNGNSLNLCVSGCLPNGTPANAPIPNTVINTFPPTTVQQPGTPLPPQPAPNRPVLTIPPVSLPVNLN